MYGGWHDDICEPFTIADDDPALDGEGNLIVDGKGKRVTAGFTIKRTPLGQAESNMRKFGNAMKLYEGNNGNGSVQPVENVLRSHVLNNTKRNDSMGVIQHPGNDAIPKNPAPQIGVRKTSGNYIPESDEEHWARKESTFYLPTDFPGHDTVPTFFKDGRSLREHLRKEGVTTKTQLMEKTELLQDCFVHELNMEEVEDVEDLDEDLTTYA